MIKVRYLLRQKWRQWANINTQRKNRKNPLHSRNRPRIFTSLLTLCHHLGVWVQHQRHRFKVGVILKQCEEMLNSVGFVWDKWSYMRASYLTRDIKQRIVFIWMIVAIDPNSKRHMSTSLVIDIIYLHIWEVTYYKSAYTPNPLHPRPTG